jgi:hypothetical protein
MLPFRTCLLFALLGTIAFGGKAYAQSPNAAKISLHIDAPRSVAVGAPLRLEITLRNNSTQTINLDMDNLLHAEWSFDILVKDSSGRALNIQEPPRVTTNNGVARLKPNETLKASADLMRVFHLQPGVYTVQVSRYDGEFWIKEAEPRKLGDKGSKSDFVPPPAGEKAESNIIRLTVTSKEAE